VTFWVPTHAPKYLVTYFESVSAFLLYSAPGCPGRDFPLESYLPHRRLWGGRSTSRVRLPYTDTITMALKPPFPSLYHCPGLSGPEAFPRRRSLPGLIWRRPGWATSLPRRRLALATLPLGVSPPRRRLALTLTLQPLTLTMT